MDPDDDGLIDFKPKQQRHGTKSTASDEEFIDTRLIKLRRRIKNTSATRFSAAKRVRFNYDLGNITIIVLSLWSIAIAVMLAEKVIDLNGAQEKVVEVAGVILPVFIVVFSLIEGGNNFLRSYQLESNARQLRELADEYAGEISNLNAEHPDNKVKKFEHYSKKYNDILERSPINHDDVYHWSKHYMEKRDRFNNKEKQSKFLSVYYFLMTLLMWVRRQGQRILYVSFWFAPFSMFMDWKKLGFFG